MEELEAYLFADNPNCSTNSSLSDENESKSINENFSDGLGSGVNSFSSSSSKTIDLENLCMEAEVNVDDLVLEFKRGLRLPGVKHDNALVNDIAIQKASAEIHKVEAKACDTYSKFLSDSPVSGSKYYSDPKSISIDYSSNFLPQEQHGSKSKQFECKGDDHLYDHGKEDGDIYKHVCQSETLLEPFDENLKLLNKTYVTGGKSLEKGGSTQSNLVLKAGKHLICPRCSVIENQNVVLTCGDWIVTRDDEKTLNDSPQFTLTNILTGENMKTLPVNLDGLDDLQFKAVSVFFSVDKVQKTKRKIDEKAKASTVDLIFRSAAEKSFNHLEKLKNLLSDYEHIEESHSYSYASNENVKRQQKEDIPYADDGASETGDSQLLSYICHAGLPQQFWS